MELEPIGRVDNLEDFDLDPIVVPIVGYTIDKEEVIQPIRFRPVQPTGAGLAILRQTRPDGNVPIGPVLHFLDECIMFDDRDLWEKFVNDETIFIEQTTLIELYKRLTEVYAARPTTRRSASPGTRPSSTPTSRAVARSRASTSKRSPSR